MGNPDIAAEFIRLVTADASRLGYYDLQYKPLLQLAQSTVGINGKKLTSEPEVVMASGILATSSFLRNVQSANRIRLSSNASAFAEIVARLFRKHFPLVATNRAVQQGNKVTDIDVVVLADDTLYLTECKHSIPPTGPHEMRDVWEDIERGAEQLHLAVEILSERDRLRDYLAGWFPKHRYDVRKIQIRTCILCSHRLFADNEYEEIPIRDFASFAKIMDDGVVALNEMHESGELVSKRYRITYGERFSTRDLDNYLSQQSRYFSMFRAFMRPASRLDVRNSRFTLANETYVYWGDPTEWCNEMDKLGFEKLEDERHTLDFPWTLEDVLATRHESDESAE